MRIIEMKNNVKIGLIIISTINNIVIIKFFQANVSIPEFFNFIIYGNSDELKLSFFKEKNKNYD